MDIRQLERQRLRAILHAEQATLEALHHPDFQLCTPSGAIWTRAFYLSGLLDGSLQYHRFEPVTPLEVRQVPGLGAVRYRSVIDVSFQGGPNNHLECWHLDIYTQAQDSAWRCLWSQATDTIRD
ncbi:nuclear transport factor 2 family protein [Deinococcus sp. HMF7604]|uniref:nuclear transport factor 2 family protein n=1 Tax=Deinococcus betulae TaxID=2873312 RepID=UPI001CCF46EA|nr:nuclear transport factor 2 family protein [Deinococcus betulae]MBZ9750049.1 nuclear transport factor 2 family protein [Deinococcus betulae]